MKKNKTIDTTRQIPNLKDRAQSAFKDADSKEYAKEYLAGIRSNWERAEDAMRRSVLFLLFLVIAFLLLQKSDGIEEISIGPIRLGDLALVQKIIPVIISYYFYSLLNLGLMFRTFRTLHSNILKVVFPSLIDNDIDAFLAPPYFSIFGDITFVPKGYEFYSLFNKLHATFVSIIVFGSVAFEAYAFYNLFILYGLTDLLTWISLSVSLMILGMCVILIGSITEV